MLTLLKISQGHDRVIIYVYIVVLESLMLPDRCLLVPFHAKFR